MKTGASRNHGRELNCQFMTENRPITTQIKMADTCMQRPFTTSLNSERRKERKVHRAGASIHLRQTSTLKARENQILPKFVFKPQARRIAIKQYTNNVPSLIEVSPIYQKIHLDIASRNNTFVLAKKKISIRCARREEHSPNPYDQWKHGKTMCI